MWYNLYSQNTQIGFFMLSKEPARHDEKAGLKSGTFDRQLIWPTRIKCSAIRHVSHSGYLQVYIIETDQERRLTCPAVD